MTSRTIAPMAGLALSLLIATGCNKTEEPMQAPPEPETAEQAPTIAAEVVEEVVVVEIPVAEDFEAEAATTITPENYAAELDAIEAELSD